MTTVSPESAPVRCSPGETLICTYCDRVVVDVETVAYRSKPDIGPTRGRCTVYGCLNIPERREA